MKIATTTGDFGAYSNSMAYTIDLMEQTPFRHLDSNLGTKPLKDNGFLENDWLEKVKKLREYAASKGMDFVQAHAPMGRPLVKDEAYEDFLFMTKRSVEVAHYLGSGNIVVHSGYRLGISKEQCFEENKKFYEEILKVAEPLGICILTENFNKMCVENMYWVDNVADELALIEYVDHPLLQACWDTGHGNMQDTTQYEAVTTLGEHLRALHVQDNLGNDDHHMAPFCGTLDLDSLMRGLQKVNYSGYFTFESGRMLLPKGTRKREFEDGVLEQAPLDIKLDAERLLYKIGEHVLRSYNCLG